MKPVGKLYPRQNAYLLPEYSAVLMATTAAAAVNYPSTQVSMVRILASGNAYINLESSSVTRVSTTVGTSTGEVSRQFTISAQGDLLFQVTGKSSSSKLSAIALSTVAGAKVRVFAHFYGAG